jgi:hypothetical protein
MRSKYVTTYPHEQTNSNKINIVQHAAAEDIAELYKSYIGLKNDIEVQNIILPKISDNLTSEISALSDTLDALVSSNLSIISMYSVDNIIYPNTLDNQYRCSYEPDFGEVTLPIADTFIEYHYIDPYTGGKSIIKDIETYVKSFITNNRFKPKADEIYENSPINAIDQYSNKIHMVKVLTSNNEIDDISLVYTLDTQTTRTLNTIRIYPMPQMVLSYESINISGPSVANATVTDYTGEAVTFLDENNVPIEKARNRSFRFPPIETNSVTVVLQNNSFTPVGDSREFAMGARIISLEQNTFLAEGYIGFEFDSSDKTAIEKITPEIEGYAENVEIFVYTSLDAFNSMESHVLYGTADTIQSKQTLPIDAEKTYVLFKLNKHDNNTTPIIKGCTIQWQ